MAKKKRVILENGNLLVYSYHPKTGAYIGNDEAYPDPLTPDEYLIPAHATTIAPAEPGVGKYAKWNGTEWTIEDIEEPVPVTPSEPDLALEARAKRNALIADTDWTQLSDVPIANRTAWATYRQALRDVPQQVGFPIEITWPSAPSYVKS